MCDACWTPGGADLPGMERLGELAEAAGFARRAGLPVVRHCRDKNNPKTMTLAVYERKA